MLNTTQMKAIIRRKGGKAFSTMSVQRIASPAPGIGEVKIKMISSRINPVDMDLMKGFPTLAYQNPQIGGVDGAGEVIKVGSQVTNFKPGDQVYFYRKFTDIGTWAQEVTIAATDIAKIPNNLNGIEAGSIALPLLTAYESLMALHAVPGETILIHGAGGGVGFQAVQLAQIMGLKVVANGSDRDREKLERVGVEQLINYKKEDFAQVLQQQVPDYIFDVIGGDVLMKSILLGPKKVVSIAFPDTSQMHKTGVNLPWYLRGLMNLMNRKFVKAATRHQVELIGQVTGASGIHLAEAAKMIEHLDYIVPIPRVLHLSEVEKNGMSERDLGKIIVFDS